MPERYLSEARQDSGPDDLNESASPLNAEPTQSSSHSGQTDTGKADGQDLDLIFGEVVSILMRSPLYQHCSLVDLEWLVIPSLLKLEKDVFKKRDLKTFPQLPTKDNSIWDRL